MRERERYIDTPEPQSKSTNWRLKCIDSAHAHQRVDRGIRRDSVMFNSGSSTQDVVELRCRSTIDLTQPDHLAKATNFEHTQHNDHTEEQTCFVCGTVGQFPLYPVRVRQNPTHPVEPFFPFLESHEPPAGHSPLSPTQSKVRSCYTCQQMLHEQWLQHERDDRPHLQRLYYLKRNDGRVRFSPTLFSTPVSANKHYLWNIFQYSRMCVFVTIIHRNTLELTWHCKLIMLLR